MIARVSNDKNDSVLRGFRCVFGSNFETYQFFAYSEERKDHIMVYPYNEEVLLNGFRLYKGDPKHEELMKKPSCTTIIIFYKFRMMFGKKLKKPCLWEARAAAARLPSEKAPLPRKTREIAKK